MVARSQWAIRLVQPEPCCLALLWMSWSGPRGRPRWSRSASPPAWARRPLSSASEIRQRESRPDHAHVKNALWPRPAEMAPPGAGAHCAADRMTRPMILVAGNERLAHAAAALARMDAAGPVSRWEW